MYDIIDSYILSLPVMTCEQWVKQAGKSGLIAGLLFKRVSELNRVR